MATRMVALLRGINLGAKKRVSMAELRELLEALGYANVKTVLQSGNAVFSCSEGAARRAADDVERAISDKLGVESKVIMRTAPELHEAIERDPLRDVATDPARHMVGFLAEDPPSEAKEGLNKLEVAPDEIRLVGQHLYMWLPDGFTNSRAGKAGWEKVVRVPVTLRNWNTVTKLAELMRM